MKRRTRTPSVATNKHIARVGRSRFTITSRTSAFTARMLRTTRHVATRSSSTSCTNMMQWMWPSDALLASEWVIPEVNLDHPLNYSFQYLSMSILHALIFQIIHIFDYLIIDFPHKYSSSKCIELVRRRKSSNLHDHFFSLNINLLLSFHIKWAVITTSSFRPIQPNHVPY